MTAEYRVSADACSGVTRALSQTCAVRRSRFCRSCKWCVERICEASDVVRTVKMRTLNVLHLASFAGNTGDGAMHDGAYRTRQADMPFEFAYDRVEMREFVHWGRRGFDADFIAQANRSDVLLLGGNSIFQMWRDNTASGTYFDFAPDYLLQITADRLRIDDATRHQFRGAVVPRLPRRHAIERSRAVFAAQ